jgi:uncharacterized RDD family membrane protein YckC
VLFLQQAGFEATHVPFRGGGPAVQALLAGTVQFHMGTTASSTALVQDGRLIGPVLVWLAIHHVGLVCEGGTLGHRLAGLRVTRVDGGRPSVKQALGRLIVRWSLSVPSLGLGFLWMLDEPQRRTWHDLLAGTVVVRESLVGQQVGPSWAASAAASIRASAASRWDWRAVLASLTSLPTTGFCSLGTEPICFMSAVSSPLGPTKRALAASKSGRVAMAGSSAAALARRAESWSCMIGE